MTLRTFQSLTLRVLEHAGRLSTVSLPKERDWKGHSFQPSRSAHLQERQVTALLYPDSRRWLGFNG